MTPARHVRPLLCALVVLLLTTPSGASAHVVPVPQFLTSGAVTTMSFAVPNERKEPMNGVTVTVPEGVRVVRARPTAGWTATVDSSSATWEGGPLPHLGLVTFRLDVDVSAPPGVITLNTREWYPSGATVDWPASVTVVPGPEKERSAGIGWGWIAAIVGVGLLFVAALALLARRRTGAAPPRP